MLIGHSLFMLSTLIVSASIQPNSDAQPNLLVLPIERRPSSAADQSLECPEACAIDHCLELSSLNRNCTKLTRDPCDCCTVCLRNETEICGGRRHIYGLCDDQLLCYKNTSMKAHVHQPGVCIKGKRKCCWIPHSSVSLSFIACVKLQCLLIEKQNRTICECAHRRVPCDNELDWNAKNHCDNRPTMDKDHEISFLKTTDGKTLFSIHVSDLTLESMERI